CQHYYTTPYSC
nr:immunoglobulin light chain junction region [Macaca mulatta]MPN94242.1 immunoglobulin light chain junction region [Macaca mulatta]